MNVAPAPRTTLTVPVRTVVPATPRSSILRLDLGRQPFAFAAGQAVNLGRHGQTLARPYSIASAPEDVARRGVVEFLVGLDAPGCFGPHLAGVAAGELVDVEGPFGRFGVPPGSAHRRFVFIAGGTGIAPLRSMIGHLAATRPDAGLALVYSARTRDDFAYLDEMSALSRDGRLSLTLTVTREEPGAQWAGGRGRLSAFHLAPFLGDAATVGRGTAYVVCGPPGFVAHAAGLLTTAGVAPADVVTERW